MAATVKAAKIAKYKDVKIRGIILNRRRKRNLELSVRDVEKTVMLPVIAKIPEDVKLTKSVLKFMPVVDNKWSKSGRAYLKLAEKFI